MVLNMSDPNEEYSSPIEFPCDFIIKVMGKADEKFEEAVFTIILHHFPTFDRNLITKRASKDNNYWALTFTVYVESKPQLDKIYQDLSDCQEVLMAL